MEKKTKRCIIDGCESMATTWKGNVLKSRDTVSAGFCEAHKNTQCKNAFGKKNCYGTYDKTLGLVDKRETNGKYRLRKNLIEQ